MSKITLLLVDDDDSLRRVTEFMLKEDGYGVATARNGREALELFERSAIDIVLTDVRMPGIDGMALLPRLKALQPDLPIIMLTAHGTISAAVEAMKAGAFDYLTKPFSRDQLRASVAKAAEVGALKTENRRLRQIVAERFSFSAMIAGSRVMRDVADAAARVAQGDTTVLLLGESGTGKELLAKAVHTHSGRLRGPFVIVNCAAIPEQLLESELFGHRRGAFSGAVSDKIGKFEAAHGGTIFLDEVGDLPLLLQAKMLRVLQEHEIDKVGEPRSLKVDVRVIAATNRDLEKMIADGSFREDLYYRLAVVPLRVPPLRERADDIPYLAEHFLRKHGAQRGSEHHPPVQASVHAALSTYPWPGNIRELENVIQRALVLDRDGTIGMDDLPERFQVPGRRCGNVTVQLPDDGISLENVERDLIAAALEKHQGNQTRAAAYLDITRSALLYRMQKYGLDRDRPIAAVPPESEPS